MGHPIEVIERWWAMFEAGEFDRLVEVTTIDADIVTARWDDVHWSCPAAPDAGGVPDGVPTMRHRVMSTIEAGNVAGSSYGWTSSTAASSSHRSGPFPPAATVS